MARSHPAPRVTFTHHRVKPPQYTAEEIAGLKEQALRLTAHIEILLEEARNYQAQLKGLKLIINRHARTAKV